MYSIIYLDPPWKFETYSDKGKGRSPEKHYQCMTIPEIKAMDIRPLMDERAAVFMWGTWPMLPRVMEVGKAWGLHYSTCAFVWVKQKRNIVRDAHKTLADITDPALWHMGTGYNTRANTEFCLLFTTKKKLKRVSRSVRQLLIAPVEQHSRKPLEVYGRIEELYGNLPRLEIFARNNQPGWDAVGNGVDGMDVNMSIMNLVIKNELKRHQIDGLIPSAP